MHIEKHQLSAVRYRNIALGIAAVQIHQFHQAVLHRQFHALRRKDAKLRESGNTRNGFPVGSGQGIHQIRRIVVAYIKIVIVMLPQPPFQHGIFIHMIGACGVGIYLLQQEELRLLFI